MFGLMCATADESFMNFVLLTTDNILLQQQTLKRAQKDLCDFCVCDETEYLKFVQNNLQKPAVIVLKKNSRVLQQWKNNFSSTNFCAGNPLFIVDDEADAASLNTQVNKNKQSTINRNLEAIKKTTSSSIYMEVTGTPQSILLQTQKSGWKPYFIYYFKPGQGYMGGNFFFPDEQPKHVIMTDNEEAQDFDKVQAINNAAAEKSKANSGKYDHLPKAVNIYGKKFTCADCGSVMKLVRSFSTKKDKVYFTFKCPTYAEHGTRACNAKKMRKADLDEAVLSTIQAQLNLFVDMQDSLHQLLAMKKAMAKQNGQKDEIKSLKKKLDQKKGLFGGLYRDLREGLISDEDYAQTREVILGEIKRLEKQLAEIEGTTNRFEEQLRGEKKWAELVKKYHNATEVTAEMVDAMIVSMKMNEDSSLSIEFNHMDEFKAIYDTIDILRKEVA